MTLPMAHPTAPCPRDSGPRRFRLPSALALLAALVVAPATQSAVIAPGLQAELKRAGSVEVLIEPAAAAADLKGLARDSFEARVGAAVDRLRAAADASQGPLLAHLEAEGIPHRRFWIVNAVWAKVDAGQLASLAERTDVRRIEANPRWAQRLPPPQPTAAKAVTAIEWGVQRVNAPALWARGIRGQGVVVAGQDTGYQWDHPALRARYRGWNGVTASHDYHWHDAIHTLIGGGSNPCGVNAQAPCDDNNHGTHTMGTMVGDDGAGNQIGVAPQAHWIACRNMERGNGTPATYLECFQWFLAPTDLQGDNPDPSRAPHIINNSWGCPPEEGCSSVGVLEQAVDALRAAGILVVVSAGNSGSSCGTVNTAPAPYASSFAVGASTSSDAIASYSSRGPATVDGISFRLKPDITAPGSGIRSSIRGGYGNSSGTSMAGPHVAAVAALLMSADPRLKGNPEAIETLLKQSARPLTSTQNCGAFPGASVPNAVFGHGLVDAEAAFNRLGALFHSGFEAAEAIAP